jgi:dTDP-4-dehydrorhamnose reductase
LDLISESRISRYFDNNDKFDLMVRCAAYTLVDKAEQEIELANKINHLVIEHLVSISNKQQARLIHIFTGYFFDGESDKPYVETDKTNPTNVYSKTNLAGEQTLQAAIQTNVIIIRASLVFSEHDNNQAKTMPRLGKERDKLSVASDQIGSPTYATDLAGVILETVKNKEFREEDQATQFIVTQMRVRQADMSLIKKFSK